MAQQNDISSLQTAWRALAGENEQGGWQTISIEPHGSLHLLAGRHFPGNEEAILVGFNAIHVPPDSQLPQGHGFCVKRVKHETPSHANVWISLARQAGGSLDMFSRMAEDVIGMLRNCVHCDDQILLQLFIGRIEAWQEFMHQGRALVLGPEAEVGLVGELFFLKLLMERGLSATAIMDGWQGPLDGLHDFLIGSGAIEVKSTVTVQGFPATVGSLEQLDPSLVQPLFLAGIRLALNSSGKTLPEIVAILSSLLDGMPEAKAKFKTLMLKAGFFAAFSDRYKRLFSHVETRVLLVNGEFPVLTRGNVNTAIRKVCYEMDLDLIGNPGMVLDRVFETLEVH
ncbi:MAG: PD-(D/E)XK motif protein [Magnetococcales bacterium]|nr:PD-(D/E)XK motif protein [Magnetococcales bacterium]MBF0420739.1 PD-(D/E)XK motif protein [Magnetococcales bacterium]